jgi:hypothetical protein
MVSGWLGMPELKVEDWPLLAMVHDWWSVAGNLQGKALLSSLMLISWELWNKGNPRVF